MKVNALMPCAFREVMSSLTVRLKSPNSPSCSARKSRSSSALEYLTAALSSQIATGSRATELGPSGEERRRRLSKTSRAWCARS